MRPTTIKSAWFSPTASTFHCREIEVAASPGISALRVQAVLYGVDGAVSFDDFDATVTGPYCWGELAACRDHRTQWGSGQ